MKFLPIFSLYLSWAVSKSESHNATVTDSILDRGVDGHNFLANILIRQLVAYIRRVISNGSHLFGIPRLDPLELNSLHIPIPIGMFSFDLELKNTVVTGIGGFVIHKDELVLPDLTFDIDVSVPRVDISTELSDLSGNFLTEQSIPIYGNGKVEFMIDGFRIQAKLYLKQSEDEKSLIIDKIEGASFEISSFETKIDEAIGGDVNHIINTLVEDVLVGYVYRFSGAISKLATTALINFINPILEQVDTWKFIAHFV